MASVGSAVREALQGGFADSRILREHGLRANDCTRFCSRRRSRANQLKDLNTALSVAAGANVQLPVTEIARSLFQQLCDPPEGAELDHSAVVTVLARINDAGQ